jgi:hypothetical protein
MSSNVQMASLLALRHEVSATGNQGNLTEKSSEACSIKRKTGRLASQKSCDLVENWLCCGKKTARTGGKLSSELHDNTRSLDITRCLLIVESNCALPRNAKTLPQLSGRHSIARRV